MPKIEKSRVGEVWNNPRVSRNGLELWIIPIAPSSLKNFIQRDRRCLEVPQQNLCSSSTKNYLLKFYKKISVQALRTILCSSPTKNSLLTFYEKKTFSSSTKNYLLELYEKLSAQVLRNLFCSKEHGDVRFLGGSTCKNGANHRSPTFQSCSGDNAHCENLGKLFDALHGFHSCLAPSALPEAAEIAPLLLYE